MINQIEKSLALLYDLFSNNYNCGYGYRVYHFAFGFRKNRLIGIGVNNMRPQDGKAYQLAKRLKIRRDYHTRHAEIDLIGRLINSERLTKDTKIVVLRLNRFGKLGQSKPCVTCRQVIGAFSIKDIAFSTREGTVVWENKHGNSETFTPYL